MLFTQTRTAPGLASPWGTYSIRLTEHGIEFTVSVKDPRNVVVLAGILGISFALAFLFSPGFWSFLVVLPQLLLLGGGLYVCLAGTVLHLVEIRPDGLQITPDIHHPKRHQFFHRENISDPQLAFEGGLTFRYGIHDIRATPPFANLREFEVFEAHFNQAIARIWHNTNLG